MKCYILITDAGFEPDGTEEYPKGIWAIKSIEFAKKLCKKMPERPPTDIYEVNIGKVYDDRLNLVKTDKIEVLNKVASMNLEKTEHVAGEGIHFSRFTANEK